MTKYCYLCGAVMVFKPWLRRSDLKSNVLDKKTPIIIYN